MSMNFDYMILSAIADAFYGVSCGTNLFSAPDSVMPYRTNTELFKEYTPDRNPIVDAGAQKVYFDHDRGRIVLDYQTLSYEVE